MKLKFLKMMAKDIIMEIKSKFFKIFPIKTILIFNNFTFLQKIEERKTSHIRREYFSHLLLSFSDYFLFVPKEYFPSGKLRLCNHFASVNIFRFVNSKLRFQIGLFILLKKKNFLT